MKTLIFSFISIFIFASAAFALSAEQRFSDPKKEQQAHKIFKEIRCVVCSGESINDSNADLAKSMRVLVRQKIKEGKNENEILDYFTTRYGDEVLLSTPLKKETALLWIMPLILLAMGILVIISSFKRKK